MKPILALLWLTLAVSAAADEPLTVAVASNFHATAGKLAAAFTASTGIDVRLSSGSTGKLYAQIVNGAPYDVFLAADVARPQRLLDQGLAAENSLVEYARGVLVLVSAEPELTGTDCRPALDSGAFRKFAIANPETAPYGYAARAWLQAEGYWEAASDRLIMGENISQTYQFVATRNATLGLVAASQLRRGNAPSPIVCQGKVELPEQDVLRQGAVQLRRSKVPGHASQFMVFLASAQAVRLIAGDGYAVAGQ